ncbi:MULTISPECIES: hypothetical protein [unclassified Janibacter]|uniref:hypothetical protein n=1 Tax=unclassified Janibacter TaxID=2649294 RepID=UPI003CFBE2B0
MLTPVVALLAIGWFADRGRRRRQREGDDVHPISDVKHERLQEQAELQHAPDRSQFRGGPGGGVGGVGGV